MQYGAWASARTLITFCVNSNEVGKIYASVGIIAAIIPLISNPVFRQIYNTVSISLKKCILTKLMKLAFGNFFPCKNKLEKSFV